mmetsp:Transcript_43656/g.120816  ORF Transcript_43656/g.120816 Transcript_43656/m.120816 type:complete len:354 (+) Transcript_43656:654-1715(+)
MSVPLVLPSSTFGRDWDAASWDDARERRHAVSGLGGKQDRSPEHIVRGVGTSVHDASVFAEAHFHPAFAADAAHGASNAHHVAFGRSPNALPGRASADNGTIAGVNCTHDVQQPSGHHHGHHPRPEHSHHQLPARWRALARQHDILDGGIIAHVGGAVQPACRGTGGAGPPRFTCCGDDGQRRRGSRARRDQRVERHDRTARGADPGARIQVAAERRPLGGAGREDRRTCTEERGTPEGFAFRAAGFQRHGYGARAGPIFSAAAEAGTQQRRRARWNRAAGREFPGEPAGSAELAAIEAIGTTSAESSGATHEPHGSSGGAPNAVTERRGAGDLRPTPRCGYAGTHVFRPADR